VYVFDNERIGNWVCEKAGGKYQSGYKCFGIEKDGELVVGVNFYDYTGENGSITIGWRIDSPHSITRYFYWMFFDYAFNHCKAKRITGLIEDLNKHSLEIAQKIGFTCEARLADYFPKGDGIVIRMYKDECKFLGEKYAPKIPVK